MINIKTDSRKIKPGDTFVALKGISSNGATYIDQAIKNGASKIVCEQGEYAVHTEHTKDTRAYITNYLKQEYSLYLKQMTIIGITGTNGKTTSAYILSQLLNRLGKKTAYIGTIGFYIGEIKKETLNNTTPDICDLYELILKAYEEKCECVVLEVSSQGLSYGRLDGIEFDIALFTNLTQDHLDYHKTMENYALAKQKLFTYLKKDGLAIINDDDPYKNYFILKQNHNITYGFDGGDYQITNFKMYPMGTTFTYQNQNQKTQIQTNLIGKYNISNLLSCIIVLEQMGFSVEQMKQFIVSLNSPSGRMEMIAYRDNLIVIDYAHTPDAMEKLITAIKEATNGNIYVVFGCTGSRDRLKRPIMTKIATDMCKYAILTSDDLHEEEFKTIIEDMTNHLENTNYEICMDRKKAIHKGIQLLQQRDVLLILGKGHEECMIIKNQKVPFHDRTVVEEYLQTVYQDS